MRIQRLTKDAKENLLEDLLKRSPNNYGQYEQGVQEILAHVKEEKDQAVFAYTKKFDHADITADNIKVTEEEIEEAYKEVDPKLVEIIRKALLNIRTYHEKQRQYSWFDSKPDGTILGQKVTPLHRVGVYVPGGKAVYPSSVLMNIVPAKVAGVDEIVMVTPPGKDGKVTPNTLVAAHEAGADIVKIFPAGWLGLRYLKDIKGPINHVKFLAAAGVNEENFADYLKAGYCAAGISGRLLDKKVIEQQNYAELTRRAQVFTKIAEEN